jgi:phage terminase large subunit-like protein
MSATLSAPSSLADQIRLLPSSERDTLIDGLTLEQASAFLYDWGSWARPGQQPPVEFALGHKSIWLVLAGRGFGKTRVGAEQVRAWNKAGRQFVNLIAPTKYDLRHVMVEGESGILAVCPRDERPEYKPSTSELVWPNGAHSLLFSAEEPDRLRGPQSDGLWGDEIAAWQYDQEAWDMAMFGLRLGLNPQAVVTTTPRPTRLVRDLVTDSTVAVTRGTTYENRANLAPTFYTKIITRYEGTRLGRQELKAEILDDNPDALWKMADIEGTRVQKLPPLVRIVIALDPATTSTEESDEWGIIAAGIDGRQPPHFYPLEDLSDIYSPDQAAKIGVNAYHRLTADRIVGEGNNGGDMIETILRYQDANIAYKKVTASRGKAIRAEPVSSLYEQHRVHHHGTLGKLESELVTWNPKTDEKSPNRLDALVWAITELAEGSGGWAGFVKGEAQESGQLPPEPRINVAGGNHDKCECGSVIWTDGKCWKCGKDRPEL